MSDTQAAACYDEECNGEWHYCWECEDGYILADCFEDTCCCADPEEEHDIIPCRTCGGRGKWKCPSARGRV
jgi:hypothetical protein